MNMTSPEPGNVESPQPDPPVANVMLRGSERASTDRHWSIYALLIAVCGAVLIGRILSLQPTLDNRNSPFFSANDRSRWATIKALGDDGTYEIDALVLQTEKIAGREVRPWDTIDKVAHRGQDGAIHYYSSKPTLLPTLLAIEYRGLQSLTGWNLEDDRFAMTQLMLVMSNAIPFVIYLSLLAILVHRLTQKAFTSWVVILVAGMGTFLSTFAISLNNHLPASIAIAVVVFCWIQLQDQKYRGLGWFLLAGAAAAFAVSNELPALSFFCLASLAFLKMNPRFFLLGFLPAAGLVASAHFGTNWQAHGSWRPAYAHRQDGEALGQLKESWTKSFEDQRLPEPLRQELLDVGVDVGDAWQLWPGEMEVPETTRRWVIMNLRTSERWALVQAGPGEPIFVHGWDNWYEYPGSYWTADRSKRSQVDQGEASRPLYLFHMLFGHHGVFSLTPVWLLSLGGAFIWLLKDRGTLRWLVIGFALLLFVCLAFYVARPMIDRNYGGQTSGLRWLFWFIPFFVLAMIPMVDRMAKSSWGRGLVIVLTVMSVASATFSAMNPWVHPWIYQWFFMPAA
jgi:hypothetical protein